MPKLSSVRLDAEKLDMGAWFTHPVGFRFRIRRVSSPAFSEALQGRLRELRGKYEGEAPDAEITRATQEEAARYLVTDWEEVESEEKAGEPRPFSPEACESVLTDPLYIDVWEWVVDCSRRAAAYRESATASTLGKS